MEKLFIYKCENITMKNGLVNDFVYAYNLTKDKYMYLLNSDLKEYDVTYLDWLVNDFCYIYGPIMLEETVKKNYVGEELFKEVATHINEIDKEYFHIIKEKRVNFNKFFNVFLNNLQNKKETLLFNVS